jgi:monofunctional biosynthetic peptidoglycan transglycosylase
VEAEDGRIWQHHGIDLGCIRRAMAHDLEIGAPGRGGSTITQQVAKNLFLSGERTLGRKLEESALAWRLEARLGKRRILELYLNLVELGPGVYGLAEGARRWFGKDVAALTPDEAAQLAALLPAPRRGMDDAFRRRLAQLRARLPGLQPRQHASLR